MAMPSAGGGGVGVLSRKAMEAMQSWLLLDATGGAKSRSGKRENHAMRRDDLVGGANSDLSERERADFFTPPAAGADFLAALVVANCFLGPSLRWTCVLFALTSETDHNPT